MCPVLDMANHMAIEDQIEIDIAPESYDYATEKLEDEKRMLTAQAMKAVQKKNGFYQITEIDE